MFALFIAFFNNNKVNTFAIDYQTFGYLYKKKLSTAVGQFIFVIAFPLY